MAMIMLFRKMYQLGRCRLHGGLTPKKHPNHKARLNALKTGRYSVQAKMKIKELKNELDLLNNLINKVAD